MPSWSLLGEVKDTYAPVSANTVARDARSLCAPPASRNHVHRGLVGMVRARAMRSRFGGNQYPPLSNRLSKALKPRSGMTALGWVRSFNR
jgi:hypothetical protein